LLGLADGLLLGDFDGLKEGLIEDDLLGLIEGEALGEDTSVDGLKEATTCDQSPVPEVVQ